MLRDRQRLAEDGIIIVVMTLEAGSGQLLAGCLLYTSICPAMCGGAFFRLFLRTVNCRNQCLDAGDDDIGVGAGTPGDGVIAPDLSLIHI